MKNCLLVTKQNHWSEHLFDLLCKSKNFKWYFMYEDSDLNTYTNFFEVAKPKYIFFFHYSKIVPKDFLEKYKCIGFHTSNLPFGKGGSPIQNQIKDGIKFSKVNMFEMTEKLDDGKIISSKDISLQGTLSDIWSSISIASYEMINTFLKDNGKEKKLAEKYKRLKLEDNKIDFSTNDISNIYDKIRMLDGDNYPRAYIEVGNFKLKFNRAHFDGNKILCDVLIEKIKGIK